MYDTGPYYEDADWISEHKNGVQFYKASPTMQYQANKVVSHELWHQKIGHPLTRRLSNLSNIILGISYKGSQKDFVPCVLKGRADSITI